MHFQRQHISASGFNFKTKSKFTPQENICVAFDHLPNEIVNVYYMIIKYFQVALASLSKK